MKFSIRDLLWLMVVAALATLWIIDRVQLQRLKTQVDDERRRLLVARDAEAVARARAEMMYQQSLQAARRATVEAIDRYETQAAKQSRPASTP